MSEAVIAGMLAGYGVAVPVGAIAGLIIGLTARTSFRVGAAAALGVATADGFYALAAVLGGAVITQLIEPMSTPLRWVAAVVLVSLAIRTAVYAVRHHRDPATARERAGLSTPGHAYLGLLGLTLLNPATIVYFGALVLGRRATDEQSAARRDCLRGCRVRGVGELATAVGRRRFAHRAAADRAPRSARHRPRVEPRHRRTLAVWLVVSR